MASQPHSAGLESECSRKNGVKVKFFSRITRVEIEFSHFKIAEILQVSNFIMGVINSFLALSR